jgi:membrane fusion protein (multidrug efflux system)
LSTRAQIEIAVATLESRKAALRTAELNLEYATIRAPLAGRIGDTTVQVGGLVNRNSAQPLTTIVPLDPIWVRFKVSESEYLASSRKTDHEDKRNTPLRMVLADGSVHPHDGHVQNATNQVDAKTGTLELQATFPNPNHNILPGQFGRVRLSAELKHDVLVVPQRAVQEMQGMQSVFVVGPDSKAQVHSVVTGAQTPDGWIVEQGLSAGERVIVDGLQKVRPGALLNPKPYRAPAGVKAR